MKIIFVLLLVSLSGCVTRTITFPNGVSYKSTSFLTNPNIGAVKVSTDTKGYLNFDLAGYNHNQTDIAELILAIATKKAALP